MDEEQREILKMIEAGTISAEQGLALMDALEGGRDAQAQDEPPPPEPSPDRPADLGAIGPWQSAWLYVLYAGVGLMIVGGLVLVGVYTGWSAWWGLCGWPVLGLGVGVATLGAWSRSARWLHVRVTGRDHRVRISMPLPLKLAAWVLGFVRRFVPKLKETAVDEVIMSLSESDQPFYVDVTDAEDGEHVQVYIG